jgi:hypothetical protein
MITITVSTTGRGLQRGGDAPECHKAEDIEHVRYAGDESRREVAVVRMSLDEALDLLEDLLGQINEETKQYLVVYAP